jgi:predicted Zn-dependent protease
MRPLAALGLAVIMIGSASPAGTQTARSISASDKATGAKAHPQLLEEFGGLYAGPQSGYVSSVGKRIAVQSGLSNSERDFTVSLLNSPVNNAFAIPGGYVYVTRQLLALMNDEAELASVLGHEIGHVAARHSNKRNTRSTITSILAAGLGAITGSSQLAQIAGYGAQLYTLRFSRQQEYEADDLGIRYLASGGYDPYASSRMLASLAAQSTIDARVQGRSDNVPTWASTHPDPGSRVARAQQRAGQMGVPVGKGLRNRDAFLAAVDGVMYDDDPKQGVVEGQTFRHPALGLRFTAPQGFAVVNGTSAVSISGSSGQAQFAGGRATDLRTHIGTVLRGLTNSQTTPNVEIRPTRVNGIDAAYATTRANSNSQQVDVTVFAYQLTPDSAYHFVTITPAGQGLGPFTSMINSFGRLSASEGAAIKPRRIDVVTVKAGDTVASLAGRMAYTSLKMERFLALNALAANSRLTPGQKVKLVV